MTKRAMVAILAEKTGVDNQDVKKVLEAFFESIREGLLDRQTFHFRGFGQFTVTKKAPKIGRDISRNIPVVIPAREVPCFKPSQNFFKKSHQRHR